MKPHPGSRVSLRCTKLLVVLVLVASARTIFCQDPHFSQLSTVPLYLNPALTGDTCARFILIGRDQWDGLTGDYATGGFSFDGAAKLTHDQGLGIGLYAMEDVQGHGVLRTDRLGATLSVPVRISRTSALVIGAGASYSVRYLDDSKLTFRDQIDPELGFVRETSERFTGEPSQHLALSAGLLYRHNRWLRIGASLEHIAQNETDLIGGIGPTPLRMAIHASAMHSVSSTIMGFSSSRIRYEVIVQTQGDHLWNGHGGFWLVSTGADYRVGVGSSEVGVGVHYRWNDAVVPRALLRFGIVSVGYAYEITVSGLKGLHTHTHELGVSVVLPCGAFFGCYDGNLRPSRAAKKAQHRDEKELQKKQENNEKRMHDRKNGPFLETG